MIDWASKAQAAIAHIEVRKRMFSVAQSFGLIDFLVVKGTATEAEMQTHGTADFVATILGNVTTAIHGGGSVPREGGWYRHPVGGTYTVDPGFALAWKAARGL